MLKGGLCEVSPLFCQRWGYSLLLRDIFFCQRIYSECVCCDLQVDSWCWWWQEGWLLVQSPASQSGSSVHPGVCNCPDR